MEEDLLKDVLVNEYTAYKLKEAGYDERTHAKFFLGKLRIISTNRKLCEPNSENNCIDSANAPFLQEAIDWLFNVHKLLVVINVHDSSTFSYTIESLSKVLYKEKLLKLKTYKEAQEHAILTSLKIITDGINRQNLH